MPIHGGRPGNRSDSVRVSTHRPVPRKPEPFRSLGVNLVRRSRYKEIDQVKRTGKHSEKPSLAARVFNR